ncbi:unnamed protein product [Linum trigynum]|uniref:Major facilitator superfamily (MFS) profile domain-containing protein n=1 Tax=Linum trigynum TaxID=586398 RepID=A0AAV2EDE0_9ROSI
MDKNEETKMEGGLLKKPLLEKAAAGSYTGAGGTSSPAVIFSTLVAVCGSFTYGVALSYSSPTQDGITKDLGLSVADYSMFGSIMTVGGMIGALFCGRMTAVLGCKYTMWMSQVFCTIGWLAIALATSSWWLDMGRLSTGIGVGFLTYVVPIYVAEVTPKDSRGAFSYASQLLINFGCSVVFLVGNFVSWRTLALIGLVPGILQLVGLFFIPESPRWLAKVGRAKEFEASLQWLRGKNVDISDEKEEIKSNVDSMKEDSNAKVTDLFQKKYAYSLIVGLGLMLLQPLGGNSGISSYASAIVERAGFPTSTGTIIISTVQVPSAAAGLFLMDFAGRRPLLMVSAGGMCFCSFLVGLSFVLQGLNLLRDLTPILTVLGLTVYTAAFSIGAAGIPWTMMSEIFPMSVKAVAGTLVTLVNWSSSWLVTYTFNFMLQWSPAGTFFIFAIVCGGIVVFTWKLVPETKGRTLEEIHASMETGCLH